MVKLFFHSMLWHCWLGDRKGCLWKNLLLDCCWWRFDWSFAHLNSSSITAISIILGSNKIQNGEILVPSNLGSPGKMTDLMERELVVKLVGCEICRKDRHSNYIRQLFPTSTPLGRIKLKVFGNSGVGKSTLIESLKCGYFGNLLRKAGITSSSTNMLSLPQKGGTGMLWYVLC